VRKYFTPVGNNTKYEKPAPNKKKNEAAKTNGNIVFFSFSYNAGETKPHRIQK
jgi:hypothetical protein